MKIPEEIFNLWQLLEKEGHSAYLVGGCVRDALLGKTPKDYDMTTSATPWEMERIFRGFSAVTIGTAFGTYGVPTSLGTVEITTFRKDGTYKNHRKPEEVQFSRDLRDDLARRDFTINAMAWRPGEGLVDLFGGQRDLDRRILRTVGDPFLRFSEDALRILRGIRFAATMDLTVEDGTLAAMEALAHTLSHLSRERIGEEMDKLLLLEKPSRGFLLMAATKVLDVVFPDLVPTVGFDQMTPYHEKTLFHHILCVTDEVPAKLPLRYAALFHDIAKPGTLSVDERGKGHFFGHEVLGMEKTREILRGYRKSNALIEDAGIFVAEHMRAHEEMTDRALRRQIRRVGKERILDLYDLMIADRACTTEGRDLEFLKLRKKRVRELLEENVVTETRGLAINGRDLIALGMKPGPGMGALLEDLLEMVTEDPSKNTKEELTKLVKQRGNFNG